jgi:hypothetical protein
MSAERLNMTSASASGIYAIATTTAGTVYTQSIYIKNDSGATSVRIGTDAFPSTGFIDYNAVTGAILSQGGSIISSSVVSMANGWKRVIWSFTGTGTITSFVVFNNSGSAGSLFLYGAQQEAGSYPTSLILTTSAAVTRLADAASKTGISSLIGQTEGTLFLEMNINKQVDLGGAGPNGIEISNGSTSGIYLGIAYTSPMTFIVARNNAGSFSSLISTTNSALGTYKMAAAYSPSGFVFYLNGVQIGTSATLPPAVTYSALALSSFSLVANPQGELYNQALLFKTRLTNAQLAELTTL